VAICVLPSISAMKKAQSVAVNAPERLITRLSPSYLSRNSAHTTEALHKTMIESILCQTYHRGYLFRVPIRRG